MLPPELSDLPPNGWLLIGLALFLVTLILARAQFGLRVGRPMTRRERSEAMVAAAVFAGGLWGAPAWWFGAEGSFPIALDPQTGRFLAAAAAVFALAALITLIRPTRQRMRYLMMMLLLYLGPLAAALIVWHREALDWSEPAAWGFALAMVLLIPGALLGLLLPAGLCKAVDVRPPSRGARMILGLAGLGAWAWGLGLYILPAGPLPELWLWQGDPLVSRLMASGLFALAGAALIGAFAGRHSATALFLVILWGAGLALAVQPEYQAGDPLPWVWVGVWAGLAVLAAIQLMIGANRRFRAPDPEPEPEREAAPERSAGAQPTPA